MKLWRVDFAIHGRHPGRAEFSSGKINLRSAARLPNLPPMVFDNVVDLAGRLFTATQFGLAQTSSVAPALSMR